MRTLKELADGLTAGGLGAVTSAEVVLIATAVKAHIGLVELLDKHKKVRLYQADNPLTPVEANILIEGYTGEGDDGYQHWECWIGPDLASALNTVPS